MNIEKNKLEASQKNPLNIYDQKEKKYPLETSRILQRLATELPDDQTWWPIWINAYNMPAFLTAYRAGIFDQLTSTPLSLEAVAEKVNISIRSARVLLGSMAALQLLHLENDKFSLSSHYKDAISHNEFKSWIQLEFDNSMTPKMYLEAISNSYNNSSLLWNRKLLEDSILQKISNNSLIFSVVCTADHINLFEHLPCSQTDLLFQFNLEHLDVSRAGLDDLLTKLISFEMIYEKNAVYYISTKFAPFFKKNSPFYKGGIFQLMGWVAPASFQQAWDALEKEQKGAIKVSENAGDTLMDQYTTTAEDEAHQFASHLNAQGAGQDVIVAQSVFKPGDRIVDVAGGGGSFSILGAALHSDTHFLIMEKGAMVRVAKKWINECALKIKGKVDVHELDMFDDLAWQKVGAEFKPNKIFLSNIFHDWSLDTSLKIARNAFLTLPEGGELVVHEMPVAENGIAPVIAANYSEALRIWTEGMQYKQSEIEWIFREAGFFKSSRCILNSLTPYCIFVACK